jgi:hypothetical protein
LQRYVYIGELDRISVAKNATLKANVFYHQGDRRFGKKIAQFFKKVAQTVSKPRPKGQNIFNKSQFESPKHLHQTTFETLKYL